MSGLGQGRVYGEGRDNPGNMKNIVILISGSGSNMAAIVRRAQQAHWERRLGARVAAVISNKADARGLVFAQEQGLATAVLDHKAYPSREDFDAALAQEIDRHAPALVVLAGFMRILTPGFVQHYAGRLLNIHPSLLPAFRGCTRTRGPSRPVASSPGPLCTRSRPSSTMAPSWRRRWCRSCPMTAPTPWPPGCSRRSTASTHRRWPNFSGSWTDFSPRSAQIADAPRR